MFDAATEILTDVGWKLSNLVCKTDRLATLSIGNKIEYNVPRSVLRKRHRGKMYRLRSRGVDLLLTSDHKIYASRSSKWHGKKSPFLKIDFPLQLRSISELLGRRKRFQKWAKWGGSPYRTTFVIPKRVVTWPDRNMTRIYPKISIPIKAWLRFLGWYVSEGWTTSKGAMIKVAYNYNDRNEINEVEAAIRDLRLPYRRDPLCFVLSKKQLGLWLNEHCGKRSNEKRVPDFIKALPPELIRVFLSSLFLGDAGKTQSSYILASVSRRLIDEVQILLLKIGAASRVLKPAAPGQSDRAKGRYPVHFVNWMKERSKYAQTSKPESKVGCEKWIPYRGTVIKFNVKNNIIFIRRDGIPVWCGAS